MGMLNFSANEFWKFFALPLIWMYYSVCSFAFWSLSWWHTFCKWWIWYKCTIIQKSSLLHFYDLLVSFAWFSNLISHTSVKKWFFFWPHQSQCLLKGFANFIICAVPCPFFCLIHVLVSATKKQKWWKEESDVLLKLFNLVLKFSN